MEEQIKVNDESVNAERLGEHHHHHHHHHSDSHRSSGKRKKKNFKMPKMSTTVLAVWVMILTLLVVLLGSWCIEANKEIHRLGDILHSDGYESDSGDDTKVQIDEAPLYVQKESDRVIAEVKALQTENTVSFIAISDLHYNSNDERSIESLTHAGQALKRISEQVDIDFAAGLGDFTWGDATTTIVQGIDEIKNTNNILDMGFKGIPSFRAIGNHDTLYASHSKNADILDTTELFDMFGGLNDGAVFQDGERERGYCYQDLNDVKLRVICLNTNELYADENGTPVSKLISGVQFKWLASVLDLSAKKDADKWGIIILTHQPLYWTGYENTVSLLDAYVSGQSGNISHDGVNVAYDFAGKNSAKIIANFHGHLHNYRIDAIGSSRIPTVTIPNACYNRNNEYGVAEVYSQDIRNNYGEKETYDKSLSSAKDTAFCIVTVDLKYKRIYATHYGAGYSREISY